MGNFDTTVKVIVGPITPLADSTTGSVAKEVNDYLQTIDTGKTIHGIALAASGHILIVTIVHDS